MGIHENIKKLREERKLTLEEVGKRTGTTKQTIKRYESGEISTIPYDRIISLANCFGVTPGTLMGWEKPSVDNIELAADIVGDPLLMKYVKMISEMNNSDREKVFSYIEYVFSNKKTGV